LGEGRNSRPRGTQDRQCKVFRFREVAGCGANGGNGRGDAFDPGSAFFSFLDAILMTTPQLVPLFTDLSVEDSNAIVIRTWSARRSLTSSNVGAIVMVPEGASVPGCA
jgi:hypothetical protein